MRISRTLACAAIALSSMRAGAQGSITGTVFDSLRTHAPLANATVVLVERSRYATTDAHGRFTIDSVPAGHYTIGFAHAVLDSLDVQGPVVPVAVTSDRRATVTLSTPSAATMYARVCAGVRDTATGMIVGRVRDVDERSPLADAVVSTDWTEYTLTAGRSVSHRVRAAAHTNAAGVYLLCGVPTHVQLEVQTELGGFSVGPTPLMMDGRLLSHADFAISRRDSAGRNVSRGDSSIVATGMSGTASMRGVVLGVDGRPLPNATVTVRGTEQSGRTDASGAFRVTGIPAGTRTLEVRAIGLLPLTFSVDFATNAARDTTLSITRTAQELAPVAVEGKARSASWMELSGFDARRQHGLGAFVTEKEIAQHNYPDLASILRGVRGVTVQCNQTRGGPQGMPCLPQPELLGIADYTSVHCKPNYFIDGAPFIGGFTALSDIIRPEMVKGIEVYSNPGSIPAQYDLTSSTGCGSIIIWTH